MSSEEQNEDRALDSSASKIEFKDYKDESQLEHVMKLVLQDLSEPYSST